MDKIIFKVTNTAQFIAKVTSRRNDHTDYKVLGEYVNSKTKIEILHRVCKNTFLMTPNNFLNGQKCSDCNRNHPITGEIAVKIISESYPEYTLLNKDEITSLSSIAKLLHTKCSNTYTTKLANFLGQHQNRCNYCSGNRKLDIDEISDRISTIDNTYILSKKFDRGMFKNVHTSLLIYHKLCKTLFKMTFNNLRNGQRCPECEGKLFYSKAAIEIKKFLDMNKVKYKTEVSYDGLVSPKNRKLRFDFYLPKYGILLEYDGKQHFEYQISGLFTKDKVDYIKECDQLKTAFCEENEIPLFRINYKENHIDKLVNILNNLSSE